MPEDPSFRGETFPFPAWALCYPLPQLFSRGAATIPFTDLARCPALLFMVGLPAPPGVLPLLVQSFGRDLLPAGGRAIAGEFPSG